MEPSGYLLCRSIISTNRMRFAREDLNKVTKLQKQKRKKELRRNRSVRKRILCNRILCKTNGIQIRKYSVERAIKLCKPSADSCDNFRETKRAIET